MLAPLNKPSKTLTGQQNRDKSISSKGLVLPEQDVLNTEEDGLVFDLFYSSKQERSGSLGKGWQHSYTQKLTTSRNLSNASLKSSSYIKADQACLDGWDEIKESYYNGLLKNSLASYSAENKLCEIKKPNSDILQTSLLIWQDNNQLASNAKVINLPTGESLVFIQNQTEKGTWQALGNPLKTLTKADTGWIYQDQQDKLEHFNLQGLLTKIVQQGIETKLTYNDDQQLTDIAMPISNQHIKIEYGNDDKIFTITNTLTDKQISLFFDDQKRLATTELAGTLSKEYSYNKNNLLTKNSMLAKGNRIATVYEYNNDNNLISENTQLEKKPSNKIKSANNNDDDNTVIELTSADEIPTEFKSNYKYEDQKLVISNNQQEEEIAITSELINNDEIVTEKETEKSKQTFDYDEDGNLIKVTNLDKDGTLTTSEVNKSDTDTHEKSDNFIAEMSYNDQGQMITSEVFTENSGTTDTADTTNKTKEVKTRSVNGKKLTSMFKAEYAYQDNRWNRATAKKIDDNIEFMAFNEKGQVASITTAKVTTTAKSTKSTRQLKLKNLQPSDYQIINATSFTYNDLGLIKSTKNQGKTTKFTYHKNGKLASTILPNGKEIKKLAFKPSQYQQHDDAKQKSLSSYQKNKLPSIKNSNTATVFVGGFGDSWWGNTVKGYESKFKPNLDIQYAPWWDLQFEIEERKQFRGKSKKVIVGHSWGADSALSYGQYIDRNDLDLIVTTDPVGWGFNMGGNATWINAWADPGPAFSVTWHKFRICKCCCWGCCKAYGWYPRFQDNWNTGDWVAYYGGKYSTWHRWLVNHYADDSIKHKGHHDHFEKMLKKVDAKYENIDLLYWKRKHH